MNKYALTAAAALFLAATAPSFAFDAAVGQRAPSQATRISCDTHAEDDQAVCASKCEDAYLKDQQGWTADMSKIKAAKKSCDEKCGCPQNSSNL
ncbi:hypothetical protein [Methylocystis sp.]|jgi:hypothetical protein|uniref:hypothetical protein n=1 Tax=Methylocystis sp. TaxID=1911079 RepID=UPI003D0C7B00